MTLQRLEPRSARVAASALEVGGADVPRASGALPLALDGYDQSEPLMAVVPRKHGERLTPCAEASLRFFVDVLGITWSGLQTARA